MKIAIIGAGFTGLTAGYRLSKNNHKVTIFEKNPHAGGLAGGFKENNWDWSLENFYHHLFTTDKNAAILIEELGLKSELVFRQPKTSILYKNKISRFDSPASILSSPILTFPQKIQTGLATLFLKIYPGWHLFEKFTAVNLLPKLYGNKVYQIIWEPLIKGKFGVYYNQISATWFWARIKKRSYKLGYVNGGFNILIEKLIATFINEGGQIVYNQEINDIQELLKDFDKVIITVPAQIYFPKTKLLPMLGAINLILILKEQYLADNTYWLNINDPDYPFISVVEHTNFVNPQHYGGNHVLYVGGYYPADHRYFKMSKEEIFQEFLPYLQKINPGYNFKLKIENFKFSSDLYAQPIIPTNYLKIIPPHKTEIPNVYLANMQQIYPWDRGTNYAIELGEKIAEIVNQ
jgi:protoporphyrinogen oxidase